MVAVFEQLALFSVLQPGPSETGFDSELAPESGPKLHDLDPKTPEN